MFKDYSSSAEKNGPWGTFGKLKLRYGQHCTSIIITSQISWRKDYHTFWQTNRKLSRSHHYDPLKLSNVQYKSQTLFSSSHAKEPFPVYVMQTMIMVASPSTFVPTVMPYKHSAGKAYSTIQWWESVIGQRTFIAHQQTHMSPFQYWKGIGNQ